MHLRVLSLLLGCLFLVLSCEVPFITPKKDVQVPGEQPVPETLELQESLIYSKTFAYDMYTPVVECSLDGSVLVSSFINGWNLYAIANINGVWSDPVLIDELAAQETGRQQFLRLNASGEGFLVNTAIIEGHPNTYSVTLFNGSQWTHQFHINDDDDTTPANYNYRDSWLTETGEAFLFHAAVKRACYIVKTTVIDPDGNVKTLVIDRSEEDYNVTVAHGFGQTSSGKPIVFVSEYPNILNASNSNEMKLVMYCLEDDVWVKKTEFAPFFLPLLFDVKYVSDNEIYVVEGTTGEFGLSYDRFDGSKWEQLYSSEGYGQIDNINVGLRNDGSLAFAATLGNEFTYGSFEAGAMELSSMFHSDDASDDVMGQILKTTAGLYFVYSDTSNRLLFRQFVDEGWTPATRLVSPIPFYTRELEPNASMSVKPSGFVAVANGNSWIGSPLPSIQLHKFK